MKLTVAQSNMLILMNKGWKCYISNSYPYSAQLCEGHTHLAFRRETVNFLTENGLIKVSETGVTEKVMVITEKGKKLIEGL